MYSSVNLFIDLIFTKIANFSDPYLLIHNFTWNMNSSSIKIPDIDRKKWSIWRGMTQGILSHLLLSLSLSLSPVLSLGRLHTVLPPINTMLPYTKVYYDGNYLNGEWDVIILST